MTDLYQLLVFQKGIIAIFLSHSTFLVYKLGGRWDPSVLVQMTWYQDSVTHFGIYYH